MQTRYLVKKKDSNAFPSVYSFICFLTSFKLRFLSALINLPKPG